MVEIELIEISKRHNAIDSDKILLIKQIQKWKNKKERNKKIIDNILNFFI